MASSRHGFRLAKTRGARFALLVGATLLCSILLAIPQYLARGQSISAATVTEILDSNQVYIQNRTAQVNSVAQQRQQVQTRAARTSLRFNTGAIARLSHNSSLVVGQCAQLNRGTLLVNGALNGCSTSTVAGVRGTIYTITVTEAEETIIQVFEGEVVVQRHLHPEPVDPMADDADPLNPSLDPVVPSTNPVVPLVNPMEPSPGPGEPPLTPEPSPVIDPAIPGRGNPGPEPLGEPSTPVPGPTEPNLGPNLGFKPNGLVAEGPLLTATKQVNAPVSTSEPGTGGETVDFAGDDSLTIAEGQQVIIDAQADQAVILALSPEDFIDLLKGPLIDGFAVEIPGMANLRQSFERLFPGVPLPYYWLPPIPSPPIRFPFPF